jgi:hypothetical protein
LLPPLLLLVMMVGPQNLQSRHPRHPSLQLTRLLPLLAPEVAPVGPLPMVPVGHQQSLRQRDPEAAVHPAARLQAQGRGLVQAPLMRLVQASAAAAAAAVAAAASVWAGSSPLLQNPQNRLPLAKLVPLLVLVEPLPPALQRR